MATVYVRKNEPIERALKRFSALVAKEGILKDLRKKEFYMTPSQKRRLKKEESRKRFMKNLKKRRQYEEKSDRG